MFARTVGLFRIEAQSWVLNGSCAVAQPAPEAPAIRSLDQDAGVAIGMVGKGCWIKKVFTERLWRSVKYDEVCRHAHTNGTEVRTSLARYFGLYTARRAHQDLEYRGSRTLCADSNELSRLYQESSMG